MQPFIASQAGSQNPETYRQFLELQRVLGEVQAALSGPVEASGEFHDPTDTGSWRLQGKTLWQWGITAAGLDGTRIISFPRAFVRPPTVTLTPLTTNVNNAVTAEIDTPAVAQVSFRAYAVRNNATPVVGSGAIVHWQAVGEAP